CVCAPTRTPSPVLPTARVLKHVVCGQCGGPGCSTFGKDLGLGAEDCCEGTILELGEISTMVPLRPP
ncbi:unnamed protein product, partial [Ectocarpus sp. 13 AM-2016]